MINIDAEFIISCPSVELCPESNLTEFALIGRSNVGKSSLLNMLVSRKALAKVSHTPGKTKLINYFLINKAWHLVDLPGYGYAKVSKEQRAKWGDLIKSYIQLRPNLKCLFVLIDSSIPPQAIDLEFILWLNESHITYAIIYTKTDKVKQQELHANKTAFEKYLTELNPNLPVIFSSSTVEKTGRDKILEFIQTMLNS